MPSSFLLNHLLLHPERSVTLSLTAPSAHATHLPDCPPGLPAATFALFTNLNMHGARVRGSAFSLIWSSTSLNCGDRASVVDQTSNAVIYNVFCQTYNSPVKGTEGLLHKHHPSCIWFWTGWYLTLLSNCKCLGCLVSFAWLVWIWTFQTFTDYFKLLVTTSCPLYSQLLQQRIHYCQLSINPYY